MRKIIIICLTHLLVFTFFVNDSLANLKNRPYSLSLFGGGTQTAFNDSAQIWVVSPEFGAEFQLMISRRVGLLLSARYADLKNDSTGSSFINFDAGNASHQWHVRSASFGTKFYLGKRRGVTPFLKLTSDVYKWRVVILPSESYQRVEDSSGDRKVFETYEWGITTGLGIEKIYNDRIGFSLAGEFTYLTGVGTDFSQAVNDARSRGLFHLTFNLSINFGFPKKSLQEQYEEEVTKDRDYEVRTVYVGEVSESGDTVFVDQSKAEVKKEFVPITYRSAVGEDQDLDGVIDKEDQCPNTPEGALVDIDGCPNDDDKDGVLDGIDRCTNTPKEAIDFLDQFGCPLDTDFDSIPDYLDNCSNTPPSVKVDESGCPLDSDNDGVIDNIDRCPDTPEGLTVDQHGCVELEKIFARKIMSGIFLPGDRDLKKSAQKSLNKIVKLLKVYSKVTATIYGYTDNLGPTDANKNLSLKRAKSVVKYLVKKGINKKRLKAVGKGETNFIASNRVKSGREKNRRVEIEFDYSKVK